MRAYALAALLVLSACKGGGQAAPDKAEPGPSQSAPGADKSVPSASGPPVSATFLELGEGASARNLPVPPCAETLVTPVRGAITADGLPLAHGDIAAIRGDRRVVVKGNGTVLVAWARLTACDVPPAHMVIKSDAAPELSFMNGTMHARLDLDDRSVAPSFYFGRLWGTAAVPEHTHTGTWELLCAVEASGTFTLAGVPSHLGPRTCVAVPPDAKHSWQPDPGSTLSALQMYWPPGPEQRFKALAADDRDH